MSLDLSNHHFTKRLGHHKDNQFALKRPWLFFIPIGLGAIILLQGGQLLWAEGLIIALIGCLLLFSKLEFSCSSTINRIFLGILILPFLALLPSFLLPCGEWRAIAIHQFEIQLPISLVFDYRVWFEKYINLLAIVGFFYWVTSFDYTHSERRFLLLEWMYVTLFLAVGLIIANANDLMYKLVPDARVFTYFPSKNQTGTILFLGGIINFGFLIEHALKKKFGYFVLHSFLFIIFLIAIIQTHSRASFCLFFLGCICLLFFKIRIWNINLTLKIALPLIIGTSSLFFLIGGDWNRIGQIFMSGDFRFKLYEDVSVLIKDHWLSGVGLGHFEWIMPFYREDSIISQRTLHPESDFFWWVSEVGIGIIVLLFLLILNLIKSVRPIWYDGQVSTRVLPLSALIAYMGHVLVDVPMHFWGTLLPACFLYALTKKTAIPHAFKLAFCFKIVGVGLMFVGASFMIADVFQLPFHSRIIYRKDTQLINEALKLDTADSLPVVFENAIIHRPFDWWIYYSKGIFLINILNRPLEAKKNFDKALFLEPISSIVPFWIGVAWLPYDPKLTYDNWILAMHAASSDMHWLFEDMMRRSSGYPSFAPYLNELSKKNAYFRGRYLEGIAGSLFLKAFNDTLKIYPDLSLFTLDIRRKLYIRYAQLDPDGLLLFAEQHAAYIPDIWYVKSVAFKVQKKWDLAAALLVENVPIPVGLTHPQSESLKELERKFLYSPRDVWIGTDLLSLRINQKNWAGALEVIDMLLLLDLVPPYVYYWQAVASFHLKLYEASCHAWDAYFESIKKALEKDAEALRLSQDVAEANKRLMNGASGVQKSKGSGIQF